VFNIGVGFIRLTQPNLLVKTPSANTISIFLADVFLDLPVEKKENKMAVTAYSVF
jgi:hypothetical protein